MYEDKEGFWHMSSKDAEYCKNFDFYDTCSHLGKIYKNHSTEKILLAIFNTLEGLEVHPESEFGGAIYSALILRTSREIYNLLEIFGLDISLLCKDYPSDERSILSEDFEDYSRSLNFISSEYKKSSERINTYNYVAGFSCV